MARPVAGTPRRLGIAVPRLALAGWIGLTDRVTEGARVWVTGVPLAMSDFQVFNGEIDDPAADCYNMSPTMIGSDSARWGNYVCTAPKGWICECQ